MVYEVIADLTAVHLVIHKVDHEAILRIYRESAGNKIILSQRIWSSLNNHISYANLPKTSTEMIFITMLSKKIYYAKETQ